MQIECQGLFNNSQQPAPAALDNNFAVAAVLGRYVLRRVRCQIKIHW